MKKYNALVWVLLLGACLTMLWVIGNQKVQAQTEKKYEYSEFITDVAAGRVASVAIVAGQTAVGDLAAGAYPGTQLKTYTVDIPPDTDLADKLIKLAPNLKVKISSASLAQRLPELIGWLLPFGIMMALMWFLIARPLRANGGQAMDFGRSQAKLLGDNFKRVTFADVAGMTEVKEELEEIVEFLRDAERFRGLGAKIPRGVLLVGPPGCGKTLLARAVAGEAGVAFFYISGSDFVEMFVGVGASRVRDLFNQAKMHLPAIIFIDELDAVGRLRGAGLGGGHDEREQTLNALLVEMDGFDPSSDIIILAATNRPDILDPALLRPGRFDRHVVVPNPDFPERLAILELYMKDKPMAPGVNAESLAKRTPGFSGADLESLVNEGALLAGRRRQKQISMRELDEAIERVMAGPARRSRVMQEKERRIVAYHEAGHALIGSLLPDFAPTYKVTILPRGMAMGYTISLPEEDTYLSSRTDLVDQMIQALGGRVAEELVFGDVTTGAHNDLQRVSEVAREMVTEFGMSEKLGPITYGRKHGPVFLGKDFAEERNYSEDAARQIDAEVRSLVENAYERAREVVQGHRERLDMLAEALLERETLTAEEVLAIVKEGVLPAIEDRNIHSPGLMPERDKPAEKSAESKPYAGSLPLPPPLPEAP
ncbi:MAG TPA: ATP-dependent zinc metalloprotease FtsH [Armatimonadota bacterium]|jgi:cell division protease FtsH